MPSQFKEQKGYFTFAQNGDVDYLELAYLQALSIKVTQGINSYAVAVDEKTEALVTDKHRKVFDYVLRIPGKDEAEDDSWKLANEWKVWRMTPFKETVKLDSDILFSRNIDHWWHIMQQKDVCCANRVRSYESKVSNDMTYRKLFVQNNLPNVYSGFTYFRYTQTSMEFFSLVKDIYHNWPMFRDEVLTKCVNEKPHTDEV